MSWFLILVVGSALTFFKLGAMSLALRLLLLSWKLAAALGLFMLAAWTLRRMVRAMRSRRNQQPMPMR